MTQGTILGKQLDEYRLDDLLGQGGMARVYRGLDVNLKRYVAIKVIDAPFRADTEYLQRFEREAQAIAQLEHPNIVRLYRYGKSGDLLYMAMQYVEGSDLQRVLRSYEESDELMEPQEIQRITHEVCAALDYAHGKGVIHRDIKPSNIMLNAEGHAILTDFGLALLTEVGTQGKIFGTPEYIAPEQAISSAGVVPQSDLYAVGVILYRMFAGRLPFNSGDALDTAMQHMTADPIPPRQIRPDTSPQLEAVILKALAKEPEDRYESGTALAAALDGALAIAAQNAVAPTRMTVVERVALNAEALPAIESTPGFRDEAQTASPGELPPPPPAAAMASPPPQEEETTIASEEKSNWSLVAAGIGGGLVIFLILAAIFWSRNNSTQEVALAEETAVVPAAQTATRQANVTTPEAAAGSTEATTAAGAATATGGETATTAAPTFTAVPASSTDDNGREVWLPVIMRHGTAARPAATATSAPPSPSSPSATAAANPTVPPAPSATPLPAESGYHLLIAKNGEDSLFVVNLATTPFPLAQLQLGKNKLNGAEWGVALLQTGDCVAVWKDGGQPNAPAVTCNQVGERLTRDGPQRFWKNNFDLFYAGQKIGNCKKKEDTCIFQSE